MLAFTTGAFPFDLEHFNALSLQIIKLAMYLIALID